MFKILELIIQLHEVTKMLEELVQKEIKKLDVSLSIQELICLVQSFKAPNEEIKSLAEKSVYTYQHLLFNLNRLERKNLLDLKVNPNVQKDIHVNFTNKGQEIMQLLSKKQQKFIIKNIPVELDNLKDEIRLKLK